MDQAMTNHLVVTDNLEADARVYAGQSIRELAQTASWHLASLAKVIDQIEEATFVRRVPGLRAAPNSAFNVDQEAQLTRREREVLGLLVQGLSNRRIARALCISEATVKNHLHAIFLKLDVTDRTQAIAATLGGQRTH